MVGTRARCVGGPAAIFERGPLRHGTIGANFPNSFETARIDEAKLKYTETGESFATTLRVPRPRGIYRGQRSLPAVCEKFDSA